VRGGGDYFPPYPPAGFTIINWQDAAISEAQFNEL
jgi:hypothetical protein